MILETESMQRILPPLLSWFENNCRDLEWRRNPLPYYVWVSEIMLQQTRVEAVKPYFARFVKELPDTAALAACDEDRLLKLWEGLGYYSRARNLRKAAQIVEDRYQGRLPGDVEALMRLPGIGSYTAGAIASIAFRIPAPAVDGNVLRVLSRIAGSEHCIDEPKVKASFERSVRLLLEHERGIHPGHFNQALMELGAVVCLPNGAPACGRCPVSMFCIAKRERLTGRIPVRKKKKERRVEAKTVLVIRDSARMLIHRRAKKGLLAGLWELPNFEGQLSSREALEEAKALGISPLRIRPLPDRTHVFTHIEWRMKGYLILAEDMEEDAAGPASGYVFAQIQKNGKDDYPIPSAFAGYTAFFGNGQQNEDRAGEQRKEQEEGAV